jgi:hypothetical protein
MVLIELFLFGGSIIFLQLSHPVLIGILLCINALVVILLIGIYLGIFWFSYLGFLVLLGALLILFMYVISLVANEVVFFRLSGVAISIGVLYYLVRVDLCTELRSTSFVGWAWLGAYEMEFLVGMGFFVGYLLLILLLVVKLLSEYGGPVRELVYDGPFTYYSSIT